MKFTKNTTILFVVLFSLLFSTWLMVSTFSVDANTHALRIASKAWSDFGAHIPLVRSFSFGDNWERIGRGNAPESPLFPGEPIRYHFLFYASVGLLEKIGIPLDWAMNTLSIVGFAGLLILLFTLTKKLFHSLSIALLTLVFFLFNGSLSFLSFFRLHPLSLFSLKTILNNTQFPSFGPWDGGLVSAFWNLNIYTNQRHLAFSYALVLFVFSLILYVEKKKLWSKKNYLASSISIALSMGLLLFGNQAAALCLFITLVWCFLLFKHTRLMIFVSGVLSLPFLFLLFQFSAPSGMPFWKPGYLMTPPFTFTSVLWYWWNNLGLHLVTIPIGSLLLPKRLKLFLLPPFILMMLLPNLIQFSPDMINNHKFFNFAMIFGAMISAYATTMLYEYLKKKIHWIIGLFVYLIICFLLTLSGIIDIFPIINDRFITLPDYETSADIIFFKEHTPKDSVILNSTWFYHPATMAGRKIFSGYPYFTWSYGYKKENHEAIAISIYRGDNIDNVCRTLITNNISYIELSDSPETFIRPNAWFFSQHFKRIYRNDESGLSVYDVGKSCGS